MEAAIAEKVVTLNTRQAFTEDPAGVRFPERIGDLHIDQVDDLRPVDPSLGRSIHYRYPGVKVSIFVYNGGQRTIETGIAEPGIRDQIVGAIQDVYVQGKLGYYMDIQAMNPEPTELDTGAGSQDALWTRLTYAETEKGIDVEKMSWIFVTGYKNHFFKIRYTCAADLFDEEMAGSRLFGSFIADVGHIFD